MAKEEERGRENSSPESEWDWTRWCLEAVALVGGGVAVAFNIPPGTSWRAQVGFVVGAALELLALLAVILELVLRFDARKEEHRELPTLSEIESQNGLVPHEMLKAEFEYARITASEAMNDRHTVVNFYLLLAGAILSVVLALLGTSGTKTAVDMAKVPDDIQPYLGTLLLWTFCVVGLLYFLQSIRLRQAWHGSSKAMNRIKEFYITHVAGFSPQEYSQAFRWRAHTLPKPHKTWNISFLSAALIALLNSLVFVVGGLLLAGGIGLQDVWPWPMLWLVALGLINFGFSLHMYVLFLERNA
jgi:hypothetical protein